jgi:hypothetical protein
MSPAESRLAPVPGTRFALSAPVERYPHFAAPAGATGTVVYTDEYVICMHMDEHLLGAETWDNEITWAIEDDCDDLGIPSANPSAAAAFRRATTPLDDPPMPASAETPQQASAAPFARNAGDGCQIVPGESDPPACVEVHLRALLGRVTYHEATGQCAAHWRAQTPSGEYINRTATGISLDTTAQTGEQRRETAIALLVANTFTPSPR